jgi:hypothetical protein
MREEIVLARTDQGDGLTRVMVEYVMQNEISNFISSDGDTLLHPTPTMLQGLSSRMRR